MKISRDFLSTWKTQVIVTKSAVRSSSYKTQLIGYQTALIKYCPDNIEISVINKFYYSGISTLSLGLVITSI